MDTIVQLISNMGFPIAMCILLIWFINKTLVGIQGTLEALKKTVENNTAVVEKLNDRIDKLEKKE